MPATSRIDCAEIGAGAPRDDGTRRARIPEYRDNLTEQTLQSATLLFDKGTGLPPPAERFALAGEARYVRLNLNNSYGDQRVAVGLSEVNFTAAVPEPASLALLVGGLGLFAATRRRLAAR